MQILSSYWVAPVYETCGAVAGSLFARLVALSKDRDGCFYPTAKACKELGIARTAFQSAIKTLEDKGVIKCDKRMWGANLCRYFVIQYDNELLADIGVHDLNTPMHETCSGGCVRFEQGGAQNVHEGCMKRALGVYETCTNIQINTDLIRRNTDHIAREEKTEVAKSEIAAPKKSDLPKKQIEYPKTVEDVKARMDAWIEKHAALDPRFAKINTALESESFLNYWETEKGWKRGHTAVKSVEGTIATWLKNAAEKIRNYPNKGNKLSDEEFLAEVNRLNTNQIVEVNAEVVDDNGFAAIPEFL